MMPMVESALSTLLGDYALIKDIRLGGSYIGSSLLLMFNLESIAVRHVCIGSYRSSASFSNVNHVFFSSVYNAW